MSKKLVKTPLIYALEPRLLFDGDLGADAASAIVYRDGDDVAETPVVAPESQRETSRFEFQSNRRAIVFIDGALAGTQNIQVRLQLLPHNLKVKRLRCTRTCRQHGDDTK